MCIEINMHISDYDRGVSNVFQFCVEFFRFVDESPRWLFSQRRYSEANAIICKMLIQNGKADMIPEQGFTVDQLRPALGNKLDLTETETAILEKEEEDQETISPHEHKYGIRDLFRTTRLRKRTINICLNWYKALTHNHILNRYIRIFQSRFLFANTIDFQRDFNFLYSLIILNGFIQLCS